MDAQSIRSSAAFCFTAEEIEIAVAAGVYAVGVAVSELRDTSVDENARASMIKAGASCIIPDFSAVGRLQEFLFGGEQE